MILACFSLTVQANDDLVILGVDCSKNIGSGSAISADPFGSSFVKKAESGECTGIMYDTDPIPRWAAIMIIDSDPVGSYFIQGESLGDLEDYEESSEYHYDGGKLETITVVAEPGNNPYSIPWNWIVKFLGFADDELSNEVYDVEDLPKCDPNNLSNEYDFYSEIA